MLGTSIIDARSLLMPAHRTNESACLLGDRTTVDRSYHEAKVHVHTQSPVDHRSGVHERQGLVQRDCLGQDLRRVQKRGFVGRAGACLACALPG